MRSNSVRVSDRRSTLPTSATNLVGNSFAAAAAPVHLQPPPSGVPAAAMTAVSSPKVLDKWQFQQMHSHPASGSGASSGTQSVSSVPFLYQKMQYVVQGMLHSETGVPIRSHRSKLLSAVPSVFTGSDMIHWIMKKYTCSKFEAMHVANVLYNHGYFYSVERYEPIVRDDSVLFRFQTPHLWPSQKFDDSDFEYAVYLAKQVKRAKGRGVRLSDYELANLKNLKKKLLLQWDYVNDRASDETRILKEQKKIARSLMENQERAFWRLRRPHPDDRRITDCLLSRHCMGRKGSIDMSISLDVALQQEVAVLREMKEMKRIKLSTSLEALVSRCKKYTEFDPMLHSPDPSNPWISNDDTLWIMEKSLLEFPTEKQLKVWACSLQDQLNDVTGRYKFEQFCKKQYCSENIKFWQACNDLKLLPLLSIPGSVKLVYDEFIDPNAPHMVNLSAMAFEEAMNDLENPTRYAFSAAQEQIFTLMNNDIYPRFIKTDYDLLLKTAHASGSYGKGFFKKLIPRTTGRSSVEKAIPIAIISPCHPERYTKRHLSISRSSNSSNSMDNLFANVTPWDTSEHNMVLIDALTSPSSALNISSSKEGDRLRRVSAPSGPLPNEPNDNEATANGGMKQENTTGVLWMVSEEAEEDEKEKERNRRKLLKSAIRTSLIQSHSMDDLTNIDEDDQEQDLQIARKEFEQQLMSLRQPADMFDQDLCLDRKKSISIEDLHGFEAPYSPMASMTNFSPSHYSNSPRKVSKAKVAAETMVTITVPSPDYDFYSSNDSVHSAVSN